MAFWGTVLALAQLDPFRNMYIDNDRDGFISQRNSGKQGQCGPRNEGGWLAERPRTNSFLLSLIAWAHPGIEVIVAA